MAVKISGTSVITDDKVLENLDNEKTNINLGTLTSYFEGLDASSFTYDNDGRITEIDYSTGNKQTFVYTGETEIDITYFEENGNTVIKTCTVTFNANGDTTSVSWS